MNLLTLFQNTLTTSRSVAFFRVIPPNLNLNTKIPSKTCDENKEVQHEPEVVLLEQYNHIGRKYINALKYFSEVTSSLCCNETEFFNITGNKVVWSLFYFKSFFPTHALK